MKHVISTAISFLMVLAVQARTSVVLGDLKLIRIDSMNAANDLREYIPEGETSSQWTRLASVRTFADLKDPKEYLSAVAGAVKKTDPSAMFQFFENKQAKHLVLDFLVFSPRGAPKKFAEWNLMRAKYQKGRGLVVFQYAMRMYDFRASDGEKINVERERMMEPFQKATFEERED